MVAVPRRGKKSMFGKALGWFGELALWARLVVIAVPAVCSLVALHFLVKDPENFFLASELIHAFGIIVLVSNISGNRTCSGISVKSQMLTALFLAVKAYCGIVYDEGIHTAIDLFAFFSTAFVIYMILFKFKSSYQKELDGTPLYYMVVPAALLASLVHPQADNDAIINRMLWAFSIYLESVSILPQLCLMHRAKRIETFTAHYVTALGFSRFLGCAYWIIKIVKSRGMFLFLLGGRIWLWMAILAELVQSLILADFCYYFLKSVIYDQMYTELFSTI